MWGYICCHANLQNGNQDLTITNQEELEVLIYLTYNLLQFQIHHWVEDWVAVQVKLMVQFESHQNLQQNPPKLAATIKNQFHHTITWFPTHILFHWGLYINCSWFQSDNQDLWVCQTSLETKSSHNEKTYCILLKICEKHCLRECLKKNTLNSSQIINQSHFNRYINEISYN